MLINMNFTVQFNTTHRVKHSTRLEKDPNRLATTVQVMHTNDKRLTFVDTCLEC